MLRRLLLIAACSAPVVACATEPAPTAAATPAAAAAPANAVAKPTTLEVPAELRARITGMLNGYEAVPSVEQWKSLGPAGLQVLQQVASDAAELPTRRARAVAGMALVDAPGARAAVEAWCVDRNALPLVRRSAVLAFGAAFGKEALPTLGALLDDTELDVRVAAVRGLGAQPSPETRALLEKRLTTEADVGVRNELQRALARATP